MSAKHLPRRLPRPPAAGVRLALMLPLAAFSAVGSDERSDPPPAPSFRRAREHFLKGEYEQAARLYDRLGREPSDTVRAACARSEIDRQLGPTAEGIVRLEAVERQGRARADWHVCLAALLAEVGRYEEALRHNRRALAIEATDLRAHWQLGRVLETLGRTQDARKATKVFEDVMVGGTLSERAEDLTYLGRGFLRYSALSRSPNIIRRTRHVLQEVYQDAFEHVDPGYWPARLAAAELLLDKHDLVEAGADFELICKQNPRVPAAHVGLGRIALERWEFEAAEAHARDALKIHPNHVGACVLLADTRMTERRYADAAEHARHALETNPHSIEALSVLAAAQLRGGDGAASRATQQRVRAINPRPAVLHHVLGVWLSAGRQFAEAERHFKQAIDFAPAWPRPKTELGLLYMETGEEAPARRVLEAAFALDGFDQRTYHVLQLLDSLDGFARLRTEHFVIKYDEQADAIVAPYLAESLEDMYAELCERYDTEPDKRTIVEWFPDHLDFSRRIVGRPFVATVGACTGRVIAVAAPRGGSPFGQFNWRTVLRHEFTHALTLTVTENRIPHWMTEGLAVGEEPPPRTWGVMRMLSDAVRRDRLLPLASIDWGFIRPRRPNDRGLAYAQSEWMIEYIVERIGSRSVLAFLRAFRNGDNQAQAFERVLKIDPKAFDKAFKTWAARQVETWGLPDRPFEGPDEIRARLEDDPDDAATLARLAQAEWLNGELDDAEKAARDALRQDENHATALEALGHVLMTRMLRETDEEAREEWIDLAEPYLRRLIALDSDNPAAIKYLGYVEQSHGQWSEAIRWLSRYQRRFPEDPDTYRRLAAIHLRRRDVDGALRQLEQLFRLVDDEPAVASQIASIYRDRGQHDPAARWFRRVIEIDPYDAETHRARAEALLHAGAYAAAEREYRVVCRLLPQEATGYDGLSRVYQAMGNSAEAAAYQQKAEAVRGKDAGDDPGR